MLQSRKFSINLCFPFLIQSSLGIISKLVLLSFLWVCYYLLHLLLWIRENYLLYFFSKFVGIQIFVIINKLWVIISKQFLFGSFLIDLGCQFDFQISTRFKSNWFQFKCQFRCQFNFRFLSNYRWSFYCLCYLSLEATVATGPEPTIT